MAIGPLRCPSCGHGLTGDVAPHVCTPPVQARPPVLCPVCSGKGSVSAGFYMDGGTSAAREKCRSCNGKGVV